MADTHNLSADELVRKVLTDEHADLVREAVAFLCHQIMEAEVTAQIGAGLAHISTLVIAAVRIGERAQPVDRRLLA